MELRWNGVDITESVNITGCTHREMALGGCDTLELTLDHASVWYRWGPQEDDEIVITHGGWSSGKLYLNSIIPERDQYRVLATSLKSLAGRRRWQSYAGTTLEKIFEKCAAECGMEGRLYGMDGGLPYTYIIRQNEGCGAFLQRLGWMEGMCVKVYDGAFRGIGLLYAQGRDPAMEIEIAADQDGVTYRRREGLKLASLTVQTPEASAIARDTAARGDNAAIFTHLPARDPAQAGRWARGLLMMKNRKAEELTLETTLNTAFTALARVDITGSTDMTGKWIVDEAEHDIYNEHTRAVLRRVIDTVR